MACAWDGSLSKIYPQHCYRLNVEIDTVTQKKAGRGHGSIHGSLQRIKAQTNTTNISTDKITKKNRKIHSQTANLNHSSI